MTRTRIPMIALAGVAAALTLAACSSSGGNNANPGSTAPSVPAASQPAAASSSGAGSQPVAAGTKMTVTETEFHIALGAKTLKAGTYTLDVKNAGSITHALTVDGPGVEDKSTGDLNAGQSATLTITLKPGSYEIYCPVGNHKMEGMDETVKVS